MKLRILLTGGGTGGHIYPLLSVVEKLQELTLRGDTNLDLKYFGDPGEFRDLFEKHNIEIVRVPASKLRRYFDFKNLLDIFKLFAGLFISIWKVYRYMPDVAFSKGGPGALAVLAACRFYMVPIVVHDSDAVPGLTNKVTGKHARLVEAAFEAARTHFPAKREVHVVGVPIREELLTPKTTKGESRALFKLDPALPTLLFLGGSQGALAINNFVFENTLLLTEKFQILHQVGKANYDAYKTEYSFFSEKYSRETKARYVFVPYFEGDMRDAYNAADIVIARAGAGTIFEIAFVGKPAILIPLPEAANNHQWENAVAYEHAGAGVLISQENLLGRLFLIQVDKILSDPALYQKMSEAAKKFYVPNSAKMIAEDILKIAEGR